MIEVFSAGCGICGDTVQAIQEAACPSCEVTVVDTHSPLGAARAKKLGVQSLPAVAIDGKLAGCCEGAGPNLDTLRSLGLGQPL
jgi:hypothetical protein